MRAPQIFGTLGSRKKASTVLSALPNFLTIFSIGVRFHSAKGSPINLPEDKDTGSSIARFSIMVMLL